MGCEIYNLRRVERNSGLGDKIAKHIEPIEWLQIEDSLEDESYELDEGCSEHRLNLAISSHGLATGNCWVECKFGMLFVCSFGDQKDEFGSVPHPGAVCLGAVHECNEIRKRAGE